jgi:hypothetical protein
MNGTGFGRAAVNVTSGAGVFGSAANGLVLGPSAAMQPTFGFNAGAPLPSGSSLGTTARIKGQAGYIWSASTFASGGDRTDNEAIENLITVIPQSFAFLSMNTSITDPDGPGLLLHVNGVATGGTALLLRGFEWLGDEPPTEDELETWEQQTENINIIFTQLVVGQGVNDPTVPDGRGSAYSFTIPIPDLSEDFFLVTDGFATSDVPESGKYMGLTFALTVAGMAAVRRTKRASLANC